MSAAENFSIHLPGPLLADLACVQTRQTSRSGVIREANKREFRRVEALVVESWLAELHAGRANEIESRL